MLEIAKPLAGRINYHLFVVWVNRDGGHIRLLPAGEGLPGGAVAVVGMMG